MRPVLKKILKKIIPRPILKLYKKKPVSISTMVLEIVLKNPANKDYQELLKKVSLKRSVYDEMFDRGDYYLQVGLAALQCIETAIHESKTKDVKQILDLPCGHGRVLRFIAAHFSGAALTACDTNKDGVDFCKKEFGAQPVYSKPDLREFNIGKKFDLIWCGSLATHFNSENTIELFKFFHRHLNIGGLLVFSMHGALTIEWLREGTTNYGLRPESVQKLLSEVDATGFGYADYPGAGEYGVSAATPNWIQTNLNYAGNWRDYRFSEKAWVNHHDIYSVVKQ